MFILQIVFLRKYYLVRVRVSENIVAPYELLVNHIVMD